eukprot:1031749-Rhodomonas_salina.2
MDFKVYYPPDHRLNPDHQSNLLLMRDPEDLCTELNIPTVKDTMKVTILQGLTTIFRELSLADLYNKARPFTRTRPQNTPGPHEKWFAVNLYLPKGSYHFQYESIYQPITIFYDMPKTQKDFDTYYNTLLKDPRMVASQSNGAGTTCQDPIVISD